MRVYIDGYGSLAKEITSRLIKNHNLEISNIIVKTYDDNKNDYLNFLEKKKINKTFSDYDESFYRMLLKFSPDYIISLYARKKIPKNIISLAKKKTLNFHPSLLPDYKGCFSCPWVIINQENYTGITIHELNEDFDNGNILLQEKIKIDKNETAYSLHGKLNDSFVRSFDNFFINLIEQKINPKKMPSGGRYYKRELPYNGIIDKNWPINKTESFIRAMYYPPYKGALLLTQKGYVECKSFKEYLLNI